MCIGATIERAAHSASGNVAILFALLLPVIVGVCGLGVEAGYWYYKDRQLQTAADIAAFGGAVALHGGADLSKVTAAATSAAVSNGFDTASGTIEVNSPPVSGNFQNAESVEVELTLSLRRFFSAIFSSEPVTTRARAVATTMPETNTACVLALNSSASSAVTISGNSNVSSGDCNVAANSSAGNAIRMHGKAKLTAPCILAVGDVSVTTGLTLTQCKEPTVGVQPVADPYGALAAPPTTGSCVTAASNATTLWPGRYCGGLDIKSAVAFQPGVYVITDGNLSIGANADVTGSGVFFYLAGNGTVSIGANSAATLSAPTEGVYAGVLFSGDRAATSGTHSFGGGSSSSLTGALYFPAQQVSYSGGSEQGGGCTQIVADGISFSGNAHFTSTCPGTGIAPIKTAGGAGATMLVE